MSDAVFAGVARNCALFLPGVLNNLEVLGASYEKVAFVFVVSDSTDDTAQILRNWVREKAQGRVLDLGELERDMPKRTERIAFARNTCLDLIRSCVWSSYSELVMCDLDDVLVPPIDLAGFAAARQWLHGADCRAAAFPSASPAYYDIWALRHPTWCPSDCWHAIWRRAPHEAFMSAKIREVHARQVSIPKWLPAIPVQSAFGGIGIYDMSKIKGATYSPPVSRNAGQDHSPGEICEHVHFNSQIVNDGGHLAIVPSFLVHAPPQHLFQYDGCGIKWHLRMYRLQNAQNLRPSWERFAPPETERAVGCR
jgi:hypothetical protein